MSLEKLKSWGSAGSFSWVVNCQLKDLIDWAIAELEKRDQVRLVDNGDGTVTIHGLPVTIPSTLIPEGEVPIEVWSRAIKTSGRMITHQGTIAVNMPVFTTLAGELRLILADKPVHITWTPPASLPDGEYKWTHDCLFPYDEAWVYDRKLILCLLGFDWTDPPKPGRYRKVGNVATWIGE